MANLFDQVHAEAKKANLFDQVHAEAQRSASAPTIQGMPLGAPPKAELPPGLSPEGPVSKGAFRNPRTGAVYDRGRDTGTGPLGIVDAPMLGVQGIVEGAEEMARPGMRPKAGGASKILRGGMQALSPLAPAGVAAAPAKMAIGLATGMLAGGGTEAGLEALGTPKEYAELAGDLIGVGVGGIAAKSSDAIVGAGRGLVSGAKRLVPGAVVNPKRAMVQGIKPKSTNTGFSDSLDRSMPELKASEAELGKPIAGVEDLLTNIEHAKKRVWKQYSEIAGPRAQGHVDLTPVADAMVASIPDKLRLENPRGAARLEAAAAKYRRTVPLQQAESFLKTTNAELRAYEAKYPTAQRAARAGNPDTAALDAQADTLRDVIYGSLDQPGEGAAPRELKRRYGSLMNLEEEAYRRKNVAERQQPTSLSEQVGKWHAAGQAVKGGIRLISGDMGGAADIGQAVATRKAATWLKQQQTTDALIRRSFENYKGTPSPVAAPPPFRPRALLTTGDIFTPPPADTSYVRGIPGEYARKMPPPPPTAGRPRAKQPLESLLGQSVEREQPPAGADWWKQQPATRPEVEMRYAELFDQAQRNASKAARQRPAVPQSGIPEGVARGVDARQNLAKQLTGRNWDALGNSERMVIDRLISEGYGKSSQLPMPPPLPSANPPMPPPVR